MKESEIFLVKRAEERKQKSTKKEVKPKEVIPQKNAESFPVENEIIPNNEFIVNEILSGISVDDIVNMKSEELKTVHKKIDSYNM